MSDDERPSAWWLKSKFVLLLLDMLVVAVCLSFTGGILSKPRDFSSPHIVVRLANEDGSPLPDIKVDRAWSDSDCNKDGDDRAVSDQAGVATFPKVPARVGLLTGAWRKTYSKIGMCGSGSGTHTTIYVHYNGLCKVVPKDKPLHSVGQANQDPDGVWFYTLMDSQSNTVASLVFPQNLSSIDYALSSRPEGH